MRKTIIPALFAGTLLLGGCANTGYGGSPLGGILGGILGAGGGYNDRGTLSEFERAAVNACGQEAERTTSGRVGVDRVNQTSRDTVRVDGRIDTRDRNRDEFSCVFRSDGRIVDFRVT